MRNTLTILVAITAIALALPATPMNASRAALPRAPIIGSQLTTKVMSPDMIKMAEAVRAAAPQSKSLTPLQKKGGNQFSAGALDWGVFDKNERRTAVIPLTATGSLSMDWQFSLSSAYTPWFGSTVEANNIYVFQNTADGDLYGVNVADGSPAWAPVQINGQYYYAGQPTIYKDEVLTLTQGSSGSQPSIYCNDLNTGAILWHTAISPHGTNVLIQFARPSIMTVNGIDYLFTALYDASGGTGVYGFRCSDGTEDYYQFISGQYCFAGTATDMAGHLYVATDAGGVYSFTPGTPPNFVQNWQQTAPTSPVHACPVYDIATNYIYEVMGQITGPSYAYALDATDGHQVWLSSQIGSGYGGQDLQCPSCDANYVYAMGSDFYGSSGQYMSDVMAFDKYTGANAWGSYYETNDGDLSDFTPVVTTGTVSGNPERIYLSTGFGNTYSGHIRVLNAADGSSMQDYGASDYFYNFGCRVPGHYAALSYFGLFWDFASQDIVPTLHDVGVVQLIAPFGRVDSGVTVTPVCSTYNYGTVSEGPYDVDINMEGFSTQTITVPGPHDPGTKAGVTGYDVTFLQRGGPFAVSCSTKLAGDIDNTNDKMASTFYVDVHDIGVVSIDQPSGVGTPGMYIPMATVHNYGTRREACVANFKINTTPTPFNFTTTFPGGLPVGADTQLVFNPNGWYIGNGVWTCKCSLYLADDQIWSNNVLSTQFIVGNQPDCDLTGILSPNGGADTLSPITPMAKVINHSDFKMTFPVAFFFSDSTGTVIYNNSITVNNLSRNKETTLVYPDWPFPHPLGNYATTCSLYVAGDPTPENDVIHGSFSEAIGYQNITLTSIVAPTGGRDTLTAVTPSAKVRNDGSMPASFPAMFWFNDSTGATVYTQSLSVSGLSVGKETTLVFPDWAFPHAVGTYATTCSTYYGADTTPAGNVKHGSFVVYAFPPQIGWYALTPLPAGGKGKNVKDGGCLAYKPDTSGNYIYALKGNGRYEFYQYNIATNAWATKESVPAIGSSGKKKAVKKGASMTTVGAAIYATKAGGTAEFWKYNPGGSGYAWTSMPDVPTGGRNVKEGSGMATVDISDVNYVYLFKGSNTTEFYRFNTSTNAWETKAPAPAGASGKSFKDGSCIAASEDGKNVFAVKATYNEFYSYSVDSDKWTTLTPLPLIGTSGKKKKLKGGAGMASHNGIVYLTKGNNTQEFWNYVVDSNKWVQLADFPIGGGKKVKGGGSLVYASGPFSSLYAMKGNNTLEFYKYGLMGDFSLAPSPVPNTEVSSTTALRGLALTVSPNPFVNATKVAYSLPRAGNVSLKLYDVTGKLVNTLVNGYRNAGTSSFILQPSTLSRGIYLLKLESDNTTTTSKLIIQ